MVRIFIQDFSYFWQIEIILSTHFYFSEICYFLPKSEKTSFQFSSGFTFSIPDEKEIKLISFSFGSGAFHTQYFSSSSNFAEFQIHYKKSSKSFFTTGLSYQIMETRIVNFQGSSIQRGTLNSTYISIPLLYNIRFSEESSFYFTNGICINGLINAEEKGTSYLNENGSNFIKQFDYNNNIKSDYYFIDFGILFQQNLEQKISESLDLVLFARLNIGITENISNEKTSTKTKYSAARSRHNNSYSFGLSLRFL